MKTVKATIQGLSPYSQTRYHGIKKETGESHEAFENRIWREKMHKTPDGNVFIPPTAVKKMLIQCAKYLSETVPGKGKATWTKHFRSGILIVEPIVLDIKVEDVPCKRILVPYKGVVGGNPRVEKNFPEIFPWGGDIEITVLDVLLSENTDKIKTYLEQSGLYIGLGYYRPGSEAAGHWGRFKLTDFRVID